MLESPMTRQKKKTHHPTIPTVNIYLVAQHNKREVFRIRGTCLNIKHKPSLPVAPLKVFIIGWPIGQNYLNQKLFPPVVKIIKRFHYVHIIHKNTAICATVESHTKTLKPFLPSSVPNLYTLIRRVKLTSNNLRQFPHLLAKWRIKAPHDIYRQ